MINPAQEWFQSGEFANIDGVEVIPCPNPVLLGEPLWVSKGQAQVYYLQDRGNNNSWILKKFLPGRSPDARYINAIQSLIPKEHGLESGHERKVLTAADISITGYCTQAFVDWIDDTILMRVVDGCSWADLAEDVREGRQVLDKDQRISLCRKLTEKIRFLEQKPISHRDLSSQNVFVDLQDLEVHLIDWDSIYHSTLSMPANTTYGTTGYVAPFVRVNGMEEPQVTWAPHSDRFSLAILNAELLGLDAGSLLTGDGGAFDQDEINDRRGPSIDSILEAVRLNCPRAVKLVETALNAAGFDECPGPDEWTAALSRRMTASAAAGTTAKLVQVNKDAFVKLDRAAFVKLNRAALVGPPVR